MAIPGLRAACKEAANQSVRLICAGCKKDTLINRLDAINGRTRCYECEPAPPNPELEEHEAQAAAFKRTGYTKAATDWLYKNHPQPTARGK